MPTSGKTLNTFLFTNVKMSTENPTVFELLRQLITL